MGFFGSRNIVIVKLFMNFIFWLGSNNNVKNSINFRVQFERVCLNIFIIFFGLDSDLRSYIFNYIS